MTLDQLARSSGRFYGAAVQARQLEDPPFREALLAECGSLTPELALKWDSIQPAPDALDTRAMDRLADFARRHGKRLHGHTLLWHRSLPAWASPALPDADGWGAIDRYFAAIMPRYADIVDYWDVVNEPIEPLDGMDGLRRSPFLTAFGPDYVHRALESARAFAPPERLLINEYGVEYADAEDEARRRRLLRLIDDLQRKGTPLGGIGLQAHLRLARGTIDQSVLARFLAELAGRGLFVLITELDVREADFSLDIEERDRRVAAAVKDLLDVVLDQPVVRGVTTWGLSDRYSWLNEEGEVGTRHPGGNRGLPLDPSLRPKPLRDAIGAAFERAKPVAAASG